MFSHNGYLVFTDLSIIWHWKGRTQLEYLAAFAKMQVASSQVLYQIPFLGRMSKQDF